VAAIERLRRQRRTGPQIAQELDLPRSTVGAVLRRLGLGRLSALEAKLDIVRYERADITGAISWTWVRYLLAPTRGVGFKLCVSPPGILDDLSSVQLRKLVVMLLGKVTALEQVVAEQRSEIARLKGLKGPPDTSPAA
jgi:hypothetical protein